MSLEVYYFAGDISFGNQLAEIRCYDFVRLVNIGTDRSIPIKLRELYQVMDRLSENNLLIWVLQ